MNRDARNWGHCLQQAALSDIGLRRANNQDSHVVVLASGPDRWRQRGHLFMVADGMGAHAAGELASKLATDTVPLSYQKFRDLAPPDALREAVLDANRLIHTRGQASADFRGMGTTASVLLLLPQGALVAHVGDSRAYRLRRNRLEQLTFDHSLVWEIRAAENLPPGQVPDYIPKNIITRSLGPSAMVQVDVEGPFPLEVGDVFLLCSDGLSGQVTDEEIGQILGAMPPEEAVQALVDLANLRGGPDNITVVVAQVTGPELSEAGAEAMGKMPIERGGRAFAWALAVVFAVAAAGLAVAAFAFTAFWLGMAAAACAIAVVVFGAHALTHSDAHTPISYEFDARPLGRGPYVACDCPADAAFVERLAKTLDELRRLAEYEQWPADDARIVAHVDQAKAAAGQRDYSAAIRAYFEAFRYLLSVSRRP